MTRVLVAEDCAPVLRIIAGALRTKGWDVVGVDRVEDAKAAPGPWDFMVIDFGLPNGDGRQIAEHWSGVPHLFVSGEIGMELDELVRTRRLLRKPFTAAQLCTAIEERLQREVAR